MSYWDNITEIANDQTKKGLRTYGMRIEDNSSVCISDRIRYLEEELVDALMYMEWLKEKITEIGKEI